MYEFFDCTEIDISEVEYGNYEYTLREIIPETHEQEAKFSDKKIESEVLFILFPLPLSHNSFFFLFSDVSGCFAKSF